MWLSLDFAVMWARIFTNTDSFWLWGLVNRVAGLRSSTCWSWSEKKEPSYSDENAGVLPHDSEGWGQDEEYFLVTSRLKEITKRPWQCIRSPRVWGTAGSNSHPNNQNVALMAKRKVCISHLPDVTYVLLQNNSISRCFPLETSMCNEKVGIFDKVMRHGMSHFCSKREISPTGVYITGNWL